MYAWVLICVTLLTANEESLAFQSGFTPAKFGLQIPEAKKVSNNQEVRQDVSEILKRLKNLEDRKNTSQSREDMDRRHALEQKVKALETLLNQTKQIVKPDTSPTNLALHKPTKSKSSTKDAESDHAVDGSLLCNMKSRSCFSSEKQMTPWWQVDLGAVHEVKQITLLPRFEKIIFSRNITVEVYTEDPSIVADAELTPCVTYDKKIAPGTRLSLNCKTKVSGRYVRITGNGKEKRQLQFCEIQVFGP